MDKITIKINRGTCQLPACIAYEKGFFKEEGIDATLKYGLSAWMFERELLKGEIDFAYIPWTRVATANIKEKKLMIVSGSGKEEAVIVAKTDLPEDLNSAKNLKIALPVDRVPFVKDFKVRYCYFVRFLKKGNTAGNHYHVKKHELFVPIVGKFTVKLEDINTKKREKLTMHSKDYVAFYIPSKVSHAVTSEAKNGVLLVLATSAGSKKDEYPYEMKL